MTRAKRNSFDLPEGMIEGLDKFISENPKLGFERTEFIKAAVREYLMCWEGCKYRPLEAKGTSVSQETKEKVKVDAPKGLGVPSEKVVKIIADTLAYDQMWADILDKEDEKIRESNPRAYYSVRDHIRGEQRITMKNVDQFIILEKVLEEDLTKAEIELLGTFLKHYARNFNEVDQKTKNLSQEKCPGK